MEWVGPSLKASNVLVEKYFEKIPDKAFRKPKIRSSRHRKQQRSPSPSPSPPPSYEVESAPDSEQDISRNKYGNYDGDVYYNARSQGSDSPRPVYSQQPPRLRPQYTPTPARGYYTPPASNVGWTGYKPSDQSYDDDDSYYSDHDRRPRRPKAITRRSSHDGVTRQHQRRRRSSDSDSDSGSGSGSDNEDSKKSGKVDHLKHELAEYFTDSPVGLAGTAAGVVVGGWAVDKVQDHYAMEKDHKGATFLTLLGAAVGGLALNHVVDKYEEKKMEKHGKNGGADRRRDKDRGRRHDSSQDSSEFSHSYEDRY